MTYARVFSLLLVMASSLAMAVFPVAASTTHRVDSLAALQVRLASAVAGDTIVLADGVYATEAALVVDRSGAAGQPITIAAESVGGVEIGGAHGFTIVSPAMHIVVRGFKFTHAAGRTTVSVGTSHVRFMRNTFQCTGDGPYLTVSGDDAEVGYNEFRDKSTVGNMVSVTGADGQVARNLWIHHNTFHDFAPAHRNGSETIRFGLSGLSMSKGGGLVEFNLFIRCVGENELISNKSCGNTYRYNTFLDSPGAQLTLRHGNECRVYGNIFRNTAGLRIFGDRHLIFGNYFERNSLGITVGNGGAEVADGAPLTSHDRPDHCIIAFNTLVDNATHLRMTHRVPVALGATHTTFANNILQGGGLAAQFDGPNVDAVWRDNLLWKTAGAGDVPAGGFQQKDPELSAGADGVYRASRLVDGMSDGQGADDPVRDDTELRFVPIRLLTVNDVGPAAP